MTEEEFDLALGLWSFGAALVAAAGTVLRTRSDSLPWTVKLWVSFARPGDVVKSVYTRGEQFFISLWIWFGLILIPVLGFFSPRD